MTSSLDAANSADASALSRRRVLAVATVVLPVLATTACDVPNPFAGPPKPTRNVRMLRAAIGTEQTVVTAYRTVITAHPHLSSDLEPLLREHEAHLRVLHGRLIEPPKPTSKGSTAAAGSPTGADASPTPGRSGPDHRNLGNRSDALTLLQHAEQRAAAAQLRRLTASGASLAQLLASIAASDATHLPVLASLHGSGG